MSIVHKGGRSSPKRANGRISHMSPYVFRWQNYFDVITVSHNLEQDYRRVKEVSKETMALEVVTGGKNDKTEKND